MRRSHRRHTLHRRAVDARNAQALTLLFDELRHRAEVERYLRRRATDPKFDEWERMFDSLRDSGFYNCRCVMIGSALYSEPLPGVDGLSAFGVVNS